MNHHALPDTPLFVYLNYIMDRAIGKLGAIYRGDPSTVEALWICLAFHKNYELPRFDARLKHQWQEWRSQDRPYQLRHPDNVRMPELPSGDVHRLIPVLVEILDEAIEEVLKLDPQT